MASLSFRIARGEGERQQLHALHYQAFVEEIPQHPRNAAGLHVDRFHDDNVYLVALDGEMVVGSVAVRDERPFSLDDKLPDLDAHLPPGRRYCELRLLNILPAHRHNAVLPGLIHAVLEYATERQIDAAVISATTRQLRLYRRLGFVPFGPLVGTPEAPFQPMYLTAESLREHASEIASLPPAFRGLSVNLLPGPVAIHPEVRSAFESEPESHRSPRFVEELRTLRDRLCAMTNAPNAAVLVGSGTLANDVVAAQLAALGGRGVVFSNGEFGERLVDHAIRAGLDFEHRLFSWGQPLKSGSVDGAAWVWLVACETSTGMLNDLGSVGAPLALDCVSALGAVPIDLSNVWLASATSGKALGSYAGLSMVFYREVAKRRVPRYLDLDLYAHEGVPFTHSSNLVRALNTAIARVCWSERYAQVQRTGSWLRARLRAGGCTIVGEQGTPAPHVITIAVRDSSRASGELERSGFIIGHASGYLRERNWIQISLMSELPRGVLPALARELVRLCRQE
jgi:aspartate aminotransferase-like enzyme